MKKMVLLVLLSVMSVGVAADNAHAIFGGRAWRVTARQEGYGLFGLRVNKSGRFYNANQDAIMSGFGGRGKFSDREYLNDGLGAELAPKARKVEWELNPRWHLDKNANPLRRKTEGRKRNHVPHGYQTRGGQ